MISTPLIALLAASAMAGPTFIRDNAGYVDPAVHGGSMLDLAAAPLGEPLNVVISGLSSADVLTDSGFLNYANSLKLGKECLGLHSGGPQYADLGDGNGKVPQTYELRYDYGSTALGTCWESLVGGNHLRMFRQNGTLANTGALFLAVSNERDLSHQHTIAANGYNGGRDAMVKSANGTKGTDHNGVHYQTTSSFVKMLPVGTAGVNHNISLDGLVAVLTVTSSKK